MRGYTVYGVLAEQKEISTWPNNFNKGVKSPVPTIRQRTGTSFLVSLPASLALDRALPR